MTAVLSEPNDSRPETGRRPGRRPVALSPAARALRVRVAEACLLYGWTRKKAALRFDISLRSVARCIATAPGYPEGEHLLGLGLAGRRRA